MKKIYNIFTVLAIIIVSFSSCEKADYTLAKEVKHVAFDGANGSIGEGVMETIKIPVYLTSVDKAVSTTVAFSIDGVGDNPAVEGVDYNVIGGKEILLNATDIFGYIEIETIDNDLIDGDKALEVSITSSSNPDVSLGIGGEENNVYSLTIVDDEHPLASILGSYTVLGNSYFDAPYEFTTSIQAVSGDVTSVDINITGDPSDNPVRASVDLEAGTITISKGQILWVSGTYGDVYLGVTLLEGEDLVWYPDLDLVMTIKDNGVLELNDYGYHVDAGYFEAFSTTTWTKN